MKCSKSTILLSLGVIHLSLMFRAHICNNRKMYTTAEYRVLPLQRQPFKVHKWTLSTSSQPQNTLKAMMLDPAPWDPAAPKQRQLPSYGFPNKSLVWELLCILSLWYSLAQLQDTFPRRAVTLTPVRLFLSCWFWLLPHCITASCSFMPISQESKTFWEKEGKLIYLQISSYLQKNIFQVNSITICWIMLFNYKLKSKLKEDK